MIGKIKVGPLTLYPYGLVIAISVYLGWLLAKKRANIYKIPQKIFDDPILLIPLVFGLIGARVYHVLDYWSFYSKNLISIFYLTNGGLGIWGGLLGIFVGFFIISKVKRLNFLSVLDLISPSLLLGQAIGRVGNFINKEGFGSPTQKPWGIYIDPKDRPAQYINSTTFHPTFFYEAILDLIFFAVLIYLSKKLKIKGQIFAFYLIFYSLARFLVEFFRIDTWVIGHIKVAHIISVLTFLFGVVLLYLLRKKVKKEG